MNVWFIIIKHIFESNKFILQETWGDANFHSVHKNNYELHKNNKSEFIQNYIIIFK